MFYQTSCPYHFPSVVWTFQGEEGMIWLESGNVRFIAGNQSNISPVLYCL